MKIPRREGLLRVTQLTRKPEALMRDFDASEWSHTWLSYSGVTVLRVAHDNAGDVSDTCEYTEFSTPVNVEFIAQH